MMMRYQVVKDTELPESWLVYDTEMNVNVYWCDRKSDARAEWKCLDRAGWLNHVAGERK